MFIDINQLAEQGIEVQHDEREGKIHFRVDRPMRDAEREALLTLSSGIGCQRAQDDLAEAMCELRNLAIVRASVQGYLS